MLNQTVTSWSLTYFLWHSETLLCVWTWQLKRTRKEWSWINQETEIRTWSVISSTVAVVEACKVRSGLTLMEGIFSSSGFSTARTLIWVCVCYPIAGIQWGGAILDSDTEQIPKLFSLSMVATEAPAIPMPPPHPPAHLHTDFILTVVVSWSLGVETTTKTVKTVHTKL